MKETAIIISIFILLGCSNSSNSETKDSKTIADTVVAGDRNQKLSFNNEESDTIEVEQNIDSEDSLFANESSNYSLEDYLFELIDTSNNVELFDDRYIENYVLNYTPDSSILEIKNKAIIIKHPSSIEVEAMKLKYGEESFYASADDNIWYFSQASEFLRTKNIQIIEPKNIRYLELHFGFGDSLVIDIRGAVSLGWRVFFFDPDMLPIVANFVDIEEVYNMYFE